MCASRRRAACCYLAGGDVKYCLATAGGLGLDGLAGGWGRRRGDGEEGALVGFGVADEGGDVVVGEERVGENFGRWEAVRESVGLVAPLKRRVVGVRERVDALARVVDLFEVRGQERHGGGAASAVSTGVDRLMKLFKTHESR